jgi:aminoglycoside phosphotransferase (APT) family kinase protein
LSRHPKEIEMSRVPHPDVALSLETATCLIEQQCPAFAPARIELLGVGWDNEAYLVNGRAVFRFPRRRGTVALLDREVRILPLLAPHLPLPIPVPAYRGAPSDAYPYPFAGYSLIPGTPAHRLAWSEEERMRIAAPLGRFLAALHRIPISEESPAWAPGEKSLRPMSPLRDRLRALAPGLAGIEVEEVADLADHLNVIPTEARSPCWVHGDLWPSHLLVDDERRLTGVIDWGDVHLGHPAIDLMAAFCFLPPEARGAFRSAYGPIEDATWNRARRHALHYGVTLVEYGDEVGDPSLRAAGEYALWSAGSLRGPGD